MAKIIRRGLRTTLSVAEKDDPIYSKGWTIGSVRISATSSENGQTKATDKPQENSDSEKT
jgi:hypothetical protein